MGSPQVILDLCDGAAWASLLVARVVLLRLTDSTVLRSIIWIGFVVGGLMSLYVTFTWAREYDRRHPRS